MYKMSLSLSKDSVMSTNRDIKQDPASSCNVNNEIYIMMSNAESLHTPPTFAMECSAKVMTISALRRSS